MRRIFKTVSILMFCGAMMFPTTLEARGRNNGGGNGGNGGNGGGTPTATVRQSNQSRPSGVSNNRPNNNSNRPSNNSGMSNGNNRPNNNNVGVSNRNNNNRPGNGGMVNGNNNRPGNMGGMQQNNRPNNGGMQANRPNNGGMRPGNGGMRPGNVGHPGGMHSPRPYMRPTPPPAHYRPYAGWPVFRSILGVALGTTIDMTLNALLNNGYAVASYGNNMVYLTDVPMLNMTWNDATLYYGTGGGLIGSEFMYCTPAYNVTRYNAAYAALIRTYGQPYSIQELDGNGMRAVWWGPSNQYIQLSFQGSALNGVLNYCTTLSFGN